MARHRMPKPKRYVCTNPHKYCANVDRIIYRSLPERALMRYLDLNSNVAKWGSEPFPIPYIDPVDGQKHRYYPDFVIQMSNGETIIVEYKPGYQTEMPVPPSRKTEKALQRYADEYRTYLKNTAKWKAAIEFAHEKGATFAVWHEDHLRRLGIRCG